jgi:thiol-disulfide isomerase/thioredoxin
MRNYLVITIVLLFASPVFGQGDKGMVVIKGSLSGDLKGYNTMYIYTRTSNDSVAIVDGHYIFSFPFTEPGMKMLYPKYIREMRQIYQPFGILITGPGTYYVSSDITKGMQASELKGPEDMVLYKQFENDEADAIKKVSAGLVRMYGEKWWQVGEKDAVYPLIRKSSDSLRSAYIIPLLENLVKNHPDAYASAYALTGSGRQTGDLESKKKLLSLLSPRMKASQAGKNFSDYVEGLMHSSPGSLVADFTLPGPGGENISFAGIKGKYVLIDFWASWCVPCRRSFPHMREVYKKFKSGPFEILSISIDEDKAAWLKAVDEEKNPWPQALDTKNISQKGFAVTAVPASFLIDPEGRIIAKEIGFDPEGGGEIEKKLQAIFK